MYISKLSSLRSSPIAGPALSFRLVLVKETENIPKPQNLIIVCELPIHSCNPSTPQPFNSTALTEPYETTEKITVNGLQHWNWKPVDSFIVTWISFNNFKIYK